MSLLAFTLVFLVLAILFACLAVHFGWHRVLATSLVEIVQSPPANPATRKEWSLSWMTAVVQVVCAEMMLYSCFYVSDGMAAQFDPLRSTSLAAPLLALSVRGFGYLSSFWLLRLPG
ncbi:MAG: hypothetical protein H7Z21_17300 [Hymenobacter sp.]|nr:hypothetical protein [Hymenobacter sp.]